METTTTTKLTARLEVAPTIAGTLDSFTADLMNRRKLQPRAVETYLKAVRRFASWLGDDARVADITFDAIGRWQLDHGHLAPATVGKELSALRAYCRWCMRAGLRADDPTLEIEWPKRRETLPRALTGRELRQLESILARPLPVLDTKAAHRLQRDKRIVLLMLYCGLRLAEVPALDWKDVDLDAGTLIVHGKGGKQRIVILHARVIENLRETTEDKQRGAVCGHASGRKMSYKSIPHTFNRWLKDEGLDISAHQLRHTYATQLLRHGADLRVIQKALGHASLATTEHYLSVEIDQMRDAVNKLPDRFG